MQSPTHFGGAHTKVSWWDSFTGVETMNVSGPLPQQDVRERVDLIRKGPAHGTRSAAVPPIESTSMIRRIEANRVGPSLMA